MARILTAEAVDKLFDECVGDDLAGDGLVHKCTFSEEKIEANKAKIAELLGDLPDQFHAKKGGGWSFLNACNDKRGDQWTGLHMTMEKLVCLGIAAGLAKWLMKDMADVMPGGVPYFVVDC